MVVQKPQKRSQKKDGKGQKNKTQDTKQKKTKEAQMENGVYVPLDVLNHRLCASPGEGEEQQSHTDGGSLASPLPLWPKGKTRR